MTYRLLIKHSRGWQEVGLQHLNVESAMDEARSQWAGFPFIIIPA